jgi:MFS family permease
MRILSATESISPAIARARLLLFKPYRIGRTWKLAATGYLGGTVAFFIPFPLVYLFFLPFARRLGATPAVIAAIVAGIFVLLAIYLVIFYLCSRVQFAFFDIVLNRGEFVAPAWRKYGSQSLKWALVKIAVGTVFFALLAIPFAPIVSGIITTFSNIHLQQGQNPPPAFAEAILSVYAAVFILYFAIGIFALISSLLSDFIVPSLALENTTLSIAFRRLGQLLRNEPGAVFLYAVMKIVIYLVGGMAVGIFFYIFLFAVALVAFILGVLAYFLLQLMHVSHTVMSELAIFSGAVLYVVTAFYGIILANGMLQTIIQSYAQYFLGGRYPLLGDIIDRTTPPPEPNPPQSSYLAYAGAPSTPPPPSANNPS